jgi:hypothetical protein
MALNRGLYFNEKKVITKFCDQTGEENIRKPERGCQVVMTLVSCSERHGFKSWPQDRLFVVLLSLSKQMS